MLNGDQDNRSKIPRTLNKDQADATESKNSPSDGVEASIGPIRNPLDVNMNTSAVAPQETAVATSDVKNQDGSQLDMVIFILYSQQLFFSHFLILTCLIMLHTEYSLCRVL